MEYKVRVINDQIITADIHSAVLEAFKSYPCTIEQYRKYCDLIIEELRTDKKITLDYSTTLDELNVSTILRATSFFIRDTHNLDTNQWAKVMYDMREITYRGYLSNCFNTHAFVQDCLIMLNDK